MAYKIAMTSSSLEGGVKDFYKDGTCEEVAQQIMSNVIQEGLNHVDDSHKDQLAFLTYEERVAMVALLENMEHKINREYLGD